ncbi:MAG: GMC oxidoreductase, partial [Pseudomonadota bacterium]
SKGFPSRPVSENFFWDDCWLIRSRRIAGLSARPVDFEVFKSTIQLRALLVDPAATDSLAPAPAPAAGAEGGEDAESDEGDEGDARKLPDAAADRAFHLRHELFDELFFRDVHSPSFTLPTSGHFFPLPVTPTQDGPIGDDERHSLRFLAHIIGTHSSAKGNWHWLKAVDAFGGIWGRVSSVAPGIPVLSAIWIRPDEDHLSELNVDRNGDIKCGQIDTWCLLESAFEIRPYDAGAMLKGRLEPVRASEKSRALRGRPRYRIEVKFSRSYVPYQYANSQSDFMPAPAYSGGAHSRSWPITFRTFSPRNAGGGGALRAWDVRFDFFDENTQMELMDPTWLGKEVGAFYPDVSVTLALGYPTAVDHLLGIPCLSSIDLLSARTPASNAASPDAIWRLTIEKCASLLRWATIDGRTIDAMRYRRFLHRLHTVSGYTSISTYNTEVSPAKFVRHGLDWLLFGRGPAASPITQACAFIRTRPDEEHRPDVQIQFVPTGYKLVPEGLILMARPAVTLLVNVCRPKSRSTLELASSDPNNQPVIRSELLGDHEDVVRMVAGCRMARAMFESKAFSSYYQGPCLPGADVSSDEDFEAYLRDATGPAYHPVGTCRMGKDADAVVDERLRVPGVERLRVVDASIMPIVTSSNTNAPTIMIGEKASDMILRDRRAA